MPGFATDEKALAQTLAAIEAGHDLAVPPVLRSFFYLPFEHAEDIAVQRRGIPFYEKLSRHPECSQSLGYALRHLETAATLSPKTESVNWRLGLARLVAGDPEGALADFEREPPSVYRLQGMTMALHDLGRKDESASVLQELVDRENENYADKIKEKPVFVPWPFGFARAHAWMGNADEAFRYLKHTAESNDGALEGLAKHPLFTKLHDDPRWLPFLRSAGQALEQLAEIEFNPRLPDDLW